MSDLIDAHRDVIAAITALIAEDDALADTLIAALIEVDPGFTVPALIGVTHTFINALAQSEDTTPQAVWAIYAAKVAQAHADEQAALDKEEQ
ncbi:hypothetical protein ACGFMM_11165 [Streptomyces sp. NPDC048604]|uniref:hypothetical protein n=1 Tax=Streptomyces sp. NPDC048604 TaxID=3365578 RepID=UPI00371A01C9